MEKCDVGKIISKHVPEFSVRYQGIFDLSSKKKNYSALLYVLVTE